MDFRDRQVNDFLVHPFRDFERLNELVFDVGDDLVTKGFCLGGECLFDEEAAEDPAKTIIDVADALPPALRLCIGVLEHVSM